MALTSTQAKRSKEFGFPVMVQTKNDVWEGFIVEVAEKCALLIGHAKKNGAADRWLGWVGLEDLCFPKQD